MGYHGLGYHGILCGRVIQISVETNITLYHTKYYIDYIAYYVILVWHTIGSHLLRCYDISCDFATW